MFFAYDAISAELADRGHALKNGHAAPSDTGTRQPGLTKKRERASIARGNTAHATGQLESPKSRHIQRLLHDEIEINRQYFGHGKFLMRHAVVPLAESLLAASRHARVDSGTPIIFRFFSPSRAAHCHMMMPCSKCADVTSIKPPIFPSIVNFLDAISRMPILNNRRRLYTQSEKHHYAPATTYATGAPSLSFH